MKAVRSAHRHGDLHISNGSTVGLSQPPVISTIRIKILASQQSTLPSYSKNDVAPIKLPKNTNPSINPPSTLQEGLTDVDQSRPLQRSPDQHRILLIIAWIATITSMLMYFSYIDQIRLNWQGHKGSLIQPIAATINCTLWVSIGLLRKPRDWPVALASSPGVLLGAITVITAW